MKSLPYSILLVGLLAVLSGCATKTYVNEQNAALSSRIGSDVLRLDTRIASLDSRVGKNEAGLAGTSRLAQEALDRANAAHKLAEGKLVYEVTLTDDQILFGSGKAALSKASQQSLSDLVEKLKVDNKLAYIEIQGHTDRTGAKDFNKKLGLDRAEAVRDYLHSAGVPLHRMNTISYGSSQPVKGKRAQSRRVVLMVLA